jgi:hypothetical protein
MNPPRNPGTPEWNSTTSNTATPRSPSMSGRKVPPERRPAGTRELAWAAIRTSVEGSWETAATGKSFMGGAQTWILRRVDTSPTRGKYCPTHVKSVPPNFDVNFTLAPCTAQMAKPKFDGTNRDCSRVLIRGRLEHPKNETEPEFSKELAHLQSTLASTGEACQSHALQHELARTLVLVERCGLITPLTFRPTMINATCPPPCCVSLSKDSSNTIKSSPLFRLTILQSFL